MENFVELSYARHSRGFNEHGKGGKLHDHALAWFQKDTIDYWRHERMYNILDPILISDSKSRWLTVGDGRFGRDARYIIDHGCYALATDISDTLLIEAVQRGYISEYKVENAEALTFEDNMFDYVFCKEAYHHFPRPYLALYEMMRVAKKAVVLIEPNDTYFSESIFFMIRIFKKVIGMRKNFSTRHGSYEEGSANYIYPITRRELENVALALNFDLIVFKGINDFYVKGGEYEKITDNGKIQNTIKKKIRISDVLCKLCLKDYGLLGATIFKEKPSDNMIKEMMDRKMEIRFLSKNHYINEKRKNGT
jgi:ubiquinone/menaquinone biosynthesis C-methylase UbiE